jgi:hypothetical protein
MEVELNSLHPAQITILNEAKRFNVLKCGRRFGKTELTKELSIQPMLDGKLIGYFCPTYKDLFNVWNELKFCLHSVIERKDETVKQITLVTGGQIDMWSMEDPNSGRGRKYHRVIIDEAEKARYLKDAWELTIRATLVDYQGDAWFMSTPKFGETYFKSVLYKNQDKYENWKSWKYPSSANPHLPADEIAAAEAQLDPLVFRCEFLAEDVSVVERPWAWGFSRDKHLATDVNDPKWDGDINHFLYLSFDFNRNPITCAVIQDIDGQIRVIEQIKLPNSDIYAMCAYINTMYPHFTKMVTGDASGNNSTAMVRDAINYYIIIRAELMNVGQFMVPTANPKLQENQVLVNSMLSRADIKIHPVKAKALIYDMENVGTMADGSIIKGNRDDPAQQADCLDCFRYFLNTYHRNFILLRNTENQ